MVQRPDSAPWGAHARIKASGRDGYIYRQGGHWNFYNNEWTGDYTYVFCDEKQGDDFDESLPPNDCFLVDGQMVELI